MGSVFSSAEGRGHKADASGALSQWNRGNAPAAAGADARAAYGEKPRFSADCPALRGNDSSET